MNWLDGRRERRAKKQQLYDTYAKADRLRKLLPDVEILVDRSDASIVGPGMTLDRSIIGSLTLQGIDGYALSYDAYAREERNPDSSMPSRPHIRLITGPSETSK